MTDEPTTGRCACGPGGPGAGPSRRQLLRSAGAATLVPGAAVPLSLSACGTDGASTATVGADGTVVVPASDTPVGGATYYPDAEIVVTHPVDGDFRAFDATCPHQGCATSAFEDGALVCPCHGSRFDPATGEVLQGPAETGLTARAATLDGEDVRVRG